MIRNSRINSEKDRKSMDLALSYRCVKARSWSMEFPSAIHSPIRCSGVFCSCIFSTPSCSQFLISPSIDPLSDKNKELEPHVISSVLEKYGIPQDKPIVTQISRFDRLKDPLGVIDAFLLVKKYVDCRLVLAGGTASDDPEGIQVYQEVMGKAQLDSDIHVILLPHNDLEVNALQRASTVIVQKSIKEGFGLTITGAVEGQASGGFQCRRDSSPGDP